MLQQERKFLKVNFRVSYKKRVFVSKAKNVDRIDICLVEKLKSVIATKCFHLVTSSYKER